MSPPMFAKGTNRELDLDFLEDMLAEDGTEEWEIEPIKSTARICRAVWMRQALPALIAECLAAREWLRQEQISSGLVSDVRACAGGEINQACEAYRKLVAGGEK